MNKRVTFKKKSLVELEQNKVKTKLLLSQNGGIPNDFGKLPEINNGHTLSDTYEHDTRTSFFIVIKSFEF